MKLPGMKVSRQDMRPGFVKDGESRMKICRECPHLSGLRCNKCGCFMKAKVLIPSAKCPVGKW